MIVPTARRDSRITQREAALYAEVWGSLESYATIAPGERYVRILHEHCPAPALVLDAGTGSGKGALALRQAGYDVVACDLTDEGLIDAARGLRFHEACLWRPLRSQLGLGSVDAVYCTDVLEHIPTQFTMLAVSHMLAVAQRGVLITVSLHADAFGVLIGQPLHRTVESFGWWRDSLREIGTVEDARDLGLVGLYWVTR